MVPRSGGRVARWPRGPAFWRAGWQGGQEVPRSGGRAGRWPNQDVLGGSFLRCSVFFCCYFLRSSGLQTIESFSRIRGQGMAVVRCHVLIAFLGSDPIAGLLIGLTEPVERIGAA